MHIIDLLLYCGFSNVYVKDRKIINVFIAVIKESNKNGVNVHGNGNGNGGMI